MNEDTNENINGKSYTLFENWTKWQIRSFSEKFPTKVIESINL